MLSHICVLLSVLRPTEDCPTSHRRRSGLEHFIPVQIVQSRFRVCFLHCACGGSVVLMILLHRPIGLLPLLRPSIPISCLRLSPPWCVFARHGSMKIKRIQKRQPLEKNRLHRLIKGTRLEVKKQRKKKHVRNSDPMAYMDIQPVEFDPFDIRGRSTLKVFGGLQSFSNRKATAIHAYNSWYATSTTAGS